MWGSPAPWPRGTSRSRTWPTRRSRRTWCPPCRWPERREAGPGTPRALPPGNPGGSARCCAGNGSRGGITLSLPRDGSGVSVLHGRYYVRGVSSWESGSRTSTLAGQLARMGFADPARAGRLARSELGLDLGGGAQPGDGSSGTAGRAPGMTDDAALLDAIAATADPDLALSGLARIAAGRGTDAASLRAEPGFRDRLLAVLGVSKSLADHLARHPGDCHVLRGPDALRRPAAEELRAALLHAVGARPHDEVPVACVAAPQPPAPAGPAAGSTGPAAGGAAWAGPDTD